MTRINCSIPPKNLTDQHLIAELKELPRIFTAVNKRIEKGISFNDIPSEFTLGTGHCKFFYNKLKFLHIRFITLTTEYKIRFEKDWQFGIDLKDVNHLYNDYIPTTESWDKLTDRIITRITESSQIPRYYRKDIEKSDAVRILLYSNVLELV